MGGLSATPGFVPPVPKLEQSPIPLLRTGWGGRSTAWSKDNEMGRSAAHPLLGRHAHREDVFEVVESPG
jgi:hypothetical protein